MSTRPVSTAQPRVSDGASVSMEGLTPSHQLPFPTGELNENPYGIGLFELLTEDLKTHDSDWLDPGFLAVALHRLGNARMGVRSRIIRMPLTVFYRSVFRLMSWLWGIQLPYNTRLGRRVRIWHHGGIWLGARAIGDDVHIRHNTTFGVLNRHDLSAKPIIGNRVDIGVGVCILGAVTVGDDCVIGPNSVVIRDLPPHATVMGVPARQTALWKENTAPVDTGHQTTAPRNI